jgi:hypothetical protein
LIKFIINLLNEILKDNTMDDLLLQRISCGVDSTIGLLYHKRKLLCYTLEDIYRPEKIAGKTRIPAGRYRLGLRTDGGLHIKYRDRHPGHEGMIWLHDVPGFEWVYIHVGNDADDTEGCVLVGNTPNINTNVSGSIGASVDTYRRVYAYTLPLIKTGLSITIRDEDYII